MKKIILTLLLIAAGILISQATLTKAQELPESVKNCLIDKLGKAKYDAISSGTAATTEDKKKAASCFEGVDLVKKEPKTNLSSTTRECIKGIVGKEPEEMEAITDEQKEKIGQKCFAPKGVPTGIIQFPKETMACVKNIVGQDKFEKMMEGKIKPTSEEKAKIAPACFNMPPPPSNEEISKIPAEAKQCIEKILGGPIGSMDAPPSSQQQAKFEECFKGLKQQEGATIKQGEPLAGQTPPLSDQAKQCFSAAINVPVDQLFTRGPLSSSDEQKMQECMNQYPSQ